MAVKRSPASLTEAYRILRGNQSGDYGTAQAYVKSMSDVERRGRLRNEKQGKVKVRKKKRPMGAGPYPYRSRQYK